MLALASVAAKSRRQNHPSRRITSRCSSGRGLISDPHGEERAFARLEPCGLGRGGTSEPENALVDAAQVAAVVNRDPRAPLEIHGEGGVLYLNDGRELLVFLQSMSEVPQGAV